jgi:hypothetical protein
LHGGIVKAFGHPFTVGFVSDLFTDIGQIILDIIRNRKPIIIIKSMA